MRHIQTRLMKITVALMSTVMGAGNTRTITVALTSTVQAAGNTVMEAGTMEVMEVEVIMGAGTMAMEEITTGAHTSLMVIRIEHSLQSLSICCLVQRQSML